MCFVGIKGNEAAQKGIDKKGSAQLDDFDISHIYEIQFCEFITVACSNRQDLVKSSEVMTKSKLYDKNKIKKVYRAVFDLLRMDRTVIYRIK